MQARKVVFAAKGKVAIEAFELPAIENDQILIETLYSSISPGTERAHLLAEENTMTRAKGFPFQPGYSNVGRITAVGGEVSAYRPGQLVVTEQPHYSHVVLPATVGNGLLPEKYRDRYHAALSPDASFTPHHLIWPLPEGTDAKTLAACSIFSLAKVGLHGIRRARVELGEAVLIVGLGPIGLCAAQFAKLQGAYPVLGLDPSPERRKFAMERGLDAVFANAEELANGNSLMSRAKPPVVVEATGRPEVIPQAFQLCARNGRVVLLGSTRGATESVNFYTDLHKQGLEVIGVHALTRPIHASVPGNWTDWDDTRLILDLVCQGRLDSAGLITHEFPVAKAADAYQIICSSKEAVGVTLKWS
ncbi:MAG: zinc-dependent alcohol dehydrogenase [Burkholderiales bacterium]